MSRVLSTAAGALLLQVSHSAQPPELPLPRGLKWEPCQKCPAALPARRALCQLSLQPCPHSTFPAVGHGHRCVVVSLLLLLLFLTCFLCPPLPHLPQSQLGQFPAALLGCNLSTAKSLLLIPSAAGRSLPASALSFPKCLKNSMVLIHFTLEYESIYSYIYVYTDL